MTATRWIPLLLITLAPLAHGEAVHMTFTAGGTKIGEDSYESSADGRTSKSIVKMMLGAEAVSEMTMGWEGGALTLYDVIDTAGPNKGASVSWEGGKLQVRLPKRTKDLDLKVEANACFSNFHVQALRGFLASLQSSDPQNFKLVLLEGGVEVSAQANVKPGLTFVKEGKPVALKRYRVAIAGVEIEYVTDPFGAVIGIHAPSQHFEGVADGWDGIFKDPLAAYPELSQPTYGVKMLTGLTMKTRDGVKLVADAAIPDKPGKYPVILVRTPYGRKASMAGADLYVKRGYAYVVQDVRGREDSEGEWDPFVHERQDGADTVDWVAKQAWSDGAVGMIGGSYGGYVQWAAAVEHPKALKCIIPQVAPPDAFNNLPYDQGTFMLFPSLWWLNLVKEKQTRLDLAIKVPAGVVNLTHLPLSRLDEDVLGARIPAYQKWLERASMKDWKGYDHSASVDKVTIPVLHISGWFDGDESGTMLHWERRRKAGLNNEQWLIYGPWVHGFNVSTKIGDVEYGPDSVIEIDSTYLRFFDTFLKGKHVGWERQPKVRAFLSGADKWLTLADWPDAKAYHEQHLYLHADGPANSLSGAGALSKAKPGAEEPDRYTYNPASVQIPPELVPGGPMQDSLKLPEWEDRQESLFYRTPPLSAPLELLAPLKLDLYFKSTAVDTDFFATVFDEDEHGVRHIIGQSARFRASYWEGFDRRVALVPDRTYRAQLRLWDVAYEFAKGHRMGLMITSDAFPDFARNMGTLDPIKTATRMVAASQTILHDSAHPSSLMFWGPN